MLAPTRLWLCHHHRYHTLLQPFLSSVALHSTYCLLICTAGIYKGDREEEGRRNITEAKQRQQGRPSYCYLFASHTKQAPPAVPLPLGLFSPRHGPCPSPAPSLAPPPPHSPPVHHTLICLPLRPRVCTDAASATSAKCLGYYLANVLGLSRVVLSRMSRFCSTLCAHIFHNTRFACGTLTELKHAKQARLRVAGV